MFFRIYCTSLVFCFFLLIISNSAVGQEDNPYSNMYEIPTTFNYQPVQIKIGFNLGYEFPYSAGLEFSFLIKEIVDINFGCGMGMSGTKYGLGTRIFPVPNRKVSPMFGVYLYHANGIKSLNVNVYEEVGEYQITPDNAVLLNAGIRFRFGKGHYLVGGLGYSIPFEGNKAVYISGSRSSSVQSFANVFATGGFSINAGILLKLSKGHYRKLN